MDNRTEIKERMAADGVEFVLAQFVDVHGAAKVKMCPAGTLDALIDEGAGFAGAAVWGLGQGPHSHDMLGRIDLASYTPLPWLKNTARFASDLHVDGKAYGYCPRVNLKRVLGALETKHGYRANIGIEPEHFLVVRTADGGIAVWDPRGVDHLAKPCYDFKGIAPAMAYLQDITNYCNQLGWGVYQADHEDANGQYEINFAYSDALTTADRLTFFKMMTSQVAPKYGAIATHMAKPFADRTGSGAHIHYHLASATTGENLFVDESDPREFGLSKLAYHFLAGVLKHAPALCAIASPTPNCYKRLQVGPGHIEDRTISAAVNPYLLFAAYMTAGLDGITNELPIGNPNLGNLYTMSRADIYKRGLTTLPQSLKEALVELEHDSLILDALGPIQSEFLKVKWQEWNEYHRQVSRWETEQYLTLF